MPLSAFPRPLYSATFTQTSHGQDGDFAADGEVVLFGLVLKAVREVALYQ